MPEVVLRDAPPLRRSIYTRSRCDHRNVILCGPSFSSCDRTSERKPWSLSAVLLERILVEGKSALKCVCQLSSILEDELGNAGAAERFWSSVKKKLGNCAGSRRAISMARTEAEAGAATCCRVISVNSPDLPGDTRPDLPLKMNKNFPK